MPRIKSLTDTEVLTMARRLFAEGGDRAVSFGTLARATGLAASTLAQRFGTVDGMMSAAARDGWAGLISVTEALSTAAEGKGPQGLLKAIDPAGREVPVLLRLGRSDPAAAEAATQWRTLVEAALAKRLGAGEKGRLAAQALFAAWQGQILWGDPDVRVKDMARRLT